MPIDALRAARRLQEGDTSNKEQAERIAEVLSEMDVASAPKQDLEDTEERLTSMIEATEERPNSRSKPLRNVSATELSLLKSG